MECTEKYKEHIEYTFNAFCRVVIRYAAINAWRDRDKRRQREISFEYLTEEKFYPFYTSDNYFKEGNHLPLFFRALHTAGNWGTIRTLPKYGMASYTQCLTNVA